MKRYRVEWFSKGAQKQCGCKVIIDVFRASSFIVTALSLGAGEIIPVKNTMAAFEMKRKMKNGLLTGERKTRRINNFDFGNSPAELLERSDEIKGRTFIHRSSAGSVVMRSAGSALIGSVLNAKAIAERIAEKKEICFVCCGFENKSFALEDLYGVGCIINHLNHRPDNDYAIIAKNVEREDVLKCDGTKRLREHGLENDVGFSLERDRFNVVPVLDGGRITL